jgi:hypothetical protein
MKYFKNQKSSFLKKLLITLCVLILGSLVINNQIIKRTLITINLGSLYVELLNDKAEFLNFINGNNLKQVSISMSPNNYVRMQKERSKMVSNYVKDGSLWNGENNFYKAVYSESKENIDAEIKLFGMNPDHYRDSDAHSFRLKFKNSSGFGKKKVNFLNPRSRDFITDPLLNMIFSKVYSGIQIRYEPVQINLNKSNYGIFLKEDFFDKYLIEENRKRESVIFEIVDDSLQPNYYGEEKEFLGLVNSLETSYQKDYISFVDKIDHEKLKAVILMSLIINNNHPLSEINMHWYHNPVNGKIEPTIREGFVKKIDTVNIDELLKNNKLIFDVFKSKIELSFYDDLKFNLNQIRDLIITDSTYNSFKQKMIGFNKQVTEKEDMILYNIDRIESLIENRTARSNNKKVLLKKIVNDTIISGDFLIGRNEKLIIKPGIEIVFSNANVKILGGFEAIGTKKDKIIIKGDKFSGTMFFNSSQPILIQNVLFSNLTNNKSKFNQPSSITFYECKSIEILDSNFSTNLKGDDYLNFFRSEDVYLKNISFEDVIFDAIDSDFSNLNIINSSFKNIGNDAIDGSGSRISISNNYFKNVLDKAISAGENSNFIVQNSLFISNEIALVTKDGSTLTSNNNTLKKNNLDLASFIKKKYYNNPSVTLTNTSISNYLIEKNTNVKGMDSVEFSFDVESKLYGNLYGTASER